MKKGTKGGVIQIKGKNKRRVTGRFAWLKMNFK